MNNIRYYFIFFVIFIIILSCLSQEDDGENDDGDEPPMTKTKAKNVAKKILSNKKKYKQFLKVALTGEDSFTDDSEGVHQARAGKSALNLLVKGGKKLVAGSRSRIKQIIERTRKALTFVANKVSEKGKLIWEQIQKKAQGMKKKFKEYVKDTVEDFIIDVYEDVKERAYEYFKALLLEMVKRQLGIFCECPVEIDEKHAENVTMQDRGELKCKCCIKIPKLKTACVIMRARPKLKQIVVSLKYNKIEFIKGKVTDSPKGPCLVNVPADEMRICSPLPEELHVLSICIIPGTTEIDDEETGAFTGCFTIIQEQLQLAFERCMSYDPNGIEENDNYMVQIFHPDELFE